MDTSTGCDKEAFRARPPLSSESPIGQSYHFVVRSVPLLHVIHLLQHPWCPQHGDNSMGTTTWGYQDQAAYGGHKQQEQVYVDLQLPLHTEPTIYHHEPNRPTTVISSSCVACPEAHTRRTAHGFPSFCLQQTSLSGKPSGCQS